MAAKTWAEEHPLAAQMVVWVASSVVVALLLPKIQKMKRGR